MDHEALVRALLPQTPHALYAVLDAARDPRVLRELERIGGERQSLFDEPQSTTLAAYAPYLVALDQPRLQALVEVAWGKSWGVYLQSSAPAREVRRQLQDLLVAETDDGRKLHFRFYDPRVACAFFPSLTPRQGATIFDEIGAFLFEDHDPATLLRFDYADGRVTQTRLRLG